MTCFQNRKCGTSLFGYGRQDTQATAEELVLANHFLLQPETTETDDEFLEDPEFPMETEDLKDEGFATLFNLKVWIDRQQPLRRALAIEPDNVEVLCNRGVALRILPSSHTNPIFISVNDKPIRASKRSIQWCLDSVDQLWSQKERFIAADEMEDALAAYEHARQTYRRLLTETTLP